MTTKTENQHFLVRGWKRLMTFIEAMDYDYVDYTNDRLDYLQSELSDARKQLAEFEKNGPNSNVDDCEAA